MRLEDFESLVQREIPPAPLIYVGEVGDCWERTLLYGYTVERHSWHVYVKGGLIHLLVTDHAGKQIKHEYGYSWDLADLIPNKRVYPHATDLGFARITLARGVDIPWTTFAPFAPERADLTGFYRITHDDL